MLPFSDKWSKFLAEIQLLQLLKKHLFGSKNMYPCHVEVLTRQLKKG